MDFIVCNDLISICIVAGLGNMGTVSRAFVTAGCIRIKGGLKAFTLGLFL